MTSLKYPLRLQQYRQWIFVLYFVLIAIIDLSCTVDGLSTTNDRGMYHIIWKRQQKKNKPESKPFLALELCGLINRNASEIRFDWHVGKSPSSLADSYSFHLKLDAEIIAINVWKGQRYDR